MRSRIGVTLALGAALAGGFAPARAATPCDDPRPWCDALLSPDARAEILLSELTLEEKFSLMAGDDPFGVFTGNPANGTSDGIPRVGIPTIYMNDGPVGVRKGRATALPASVALAATFSPDLAESFGVVIGNEAHRKGVHVVHAPAVNIVRVPQGGRAFEYFGEDPFLASRLAVAFVRGLQAEGPIANVKHYAVNNQETDRFVTNAIVDERTLREIYLPAFEAAVVEGEVGSIMLAYNRVNGRHVTENAELVNGILKGEWGFKGFALTDYGFAQRSTVDAANAGTDLEMPQEGWYSRPALSIAVGLGLVSEATIDDHVHRILRTMFAFGIFDEEPPPSNGAIDFDAHDDLAREVAEGGIVLLANDGVLPLEAGSLGSIAVIGPEADAYRSGGGSSNVSPARGPVTPLDGIRSRVGPGVEVRTDSGFLPLLAAETARGADLAIVVVNDNQTEFVDKPCLLLVCGDPTNGLQDTLVREVAAANPNTIVVLENGSPVLMPWLDEVRAVVEAWYPGQAGGDAIASVLFGDVDPGGRLPVTFPRHELDTPVGGRPDRYPGIAFDARYSEGVFVGYRHYDEHGIEPLFPFGHGLSYASFDYRDLAIVENPDGTVTVSLAVENTSSRAGIDVVQLYLGRPDVSPEVRQPPKALGAFERIALAPGETRTVTLELGDRSFAYWDVDTDAWAIASGCYDVLVGRSSRDVHLTGVVPRGGATCD